MEAGCEMSEIKENIEKKLNNLELEEAGKLIAEYEKEVPMDLDLIVYKSIYYLYSNDLDMALEYGVQGVRRYPTNGDMYYNLACIYEQKGEILSACKNYYKAVKIYAYTKDEKEETLKIGDKLNELWNLVEEELRYRSRIGDSSYSEEVKAYVEQSRNCFGLSESSYRSMEQIVGNYYWMTEKEKRYIGAYRNQILDMWDNNCWDLIHIKGEFLKVTEGTDFQVEGDVEEYLLPIATEQVNTLHFFEGAMKDYPPVLQEANKRFNYYRVNNGTRIHSEGKSFYGAPIPLGINPLQKKLVLNIFVDGLSQEILNGEDFKKVMPYTYEFFKKGTICTQAYATAEWTYPSIANYVTGLDTPHHMLFHNMLDNAIPEDVPTLPEYFKEAGYFTSKICGNWRIIPTYGHARGYDQFIYQHQNIGFKAEMMVGEIIDHIEAFNETNQFLWMSIGDLHDIADGFDLSLAVQKEIELSERGLEKAGSTSAKQEYSENKIKAYKKTATHIDVLLNIIYKYIEEKYKDEEIIVSLFSDHGQSFLVPPEEHFMCKERAKVAFMVRGGGAPVQITDEIISTSDYLNIMCKLAGIRMKNVETNGNLPRCFGGEVEREYALDESIHPKDPYYATFFAKQYTIYFENGAPTEEDGRFELKDYSISAKDLNGNLIEDEELLDRYLDIIIDHIAPLIKYL